MTTANLMSSAGAHDLINQRLDTVDAALLGLLPRNERLALLTQIEMRLRDLTADNPAIETNLAAPCQPSLPMLSPGVVPASSGWAFATPKRRSRLALSAGVLGITALVLLFAMPVVYFAVSMVGEFLNEVAAIALIGAHIGVVTLGGIAAVVLAIAALVSLKRRQESLVGHGWAITGLCTGPLPIFLGALSALYLGIEVMESPMFSVQTATTSDADSADVGVPSEASNMLPPSDSHPAMTRGDSVPSGPDDFPDAISSRPSQATPNGDAFLEGVTPAGLVAPAAVSQPIEPASPKEPQPQEVREPEENQERG